MGGYVSCIGSCVACGRVFSFNPLTVPSMRQANGSREPVCQVCMNNANAERARRGLRPHPIASDAYTACPEEALPRGD